MSKSFSIFLFLLLALHAAAQFGSNQAKSKFEAISEASTISGGDPFQIALKITHPAGFHSYYQNPGSVGSPLKVNWELPEGFTVSDLQFPTPHISKVQSADTTTLSYGYEGETAFLFTINPPKNISGKISLKGKANWLVCDNKGCFPESQAFTISLQAGENAALDTAQDQFFKTAQKHYPSSAEGWTIKTEVSDEEIFLDVTPPAGIQMVEPFYFFSADGQIDAQTAQDHETEGSSVRLFLPINKGNDDLGIEAVAPKDSLPGIFSYHLADGSEAAIKIGAADIAPEAEEKNHAAFIPATEEEKAAGLAAYDVNTNPEYVLLGGEKEEELTFLSSLGLVFIGGLLLNLMPCVFPVLGLKVMSFVSLAGEDESKIKKHGMVFGLGLLVAMWILATIIISLNLNWGQQLSNPIFLGCIIILLFLMGLNLYGLFEFGTSMTSVGGDLQQKKGYSGSFFSGVLTTLIATPCSGPFLGAVMGFALSQDKPTALAIFTVFGLGIASPYILLSFFPEAIKKLPRPGAWMESFKQLMSFAVFATVVFFMKSYLGLVGNDAFNIFLFALVFIAMGAYIYGRWGTMMTAARKRYITGYGLAALFGIGGIALAVTNSKKAENQTQTAHKVGELAWHEWFPGKMELTRKKKRIAWIDYTADW